MKCERKTNPSGINVSYLAFISSHDITFIRNQNSQLINLCYKYIHVRMFIVFRFIDATTFHEYDKYNNQTRNSNVKKINSQKGKI